MYLMRERPILRQVEQDYSNPMVATLPSSPDFSTSYPPSNDLSTEVQQMFDEYSSSRLVEPSELADITVRPNGRVPGLVVSGRPKIKSHKPSRTVDLGEQDLVCRAPGYHGERLNELDSVDEMVGVCVDRIFH